MLLDKENPRLAVDGYVVEWCISSLTDWTPIRWVRTWPDGTEQTEMWPVILQTNHDSIANLNFHFNEGGEKAKQIARMVLLIRQIEEGVVHMPYVSFPPVLGWDPVHKTCTLLFDAE